MTKLPDITVHSIDEYVHTIASIVSQGETFWYRGQQNACWNVQAALWRKDDSRPSYTAADERNFTHRFRTRAAVRYPHERLSYDDHPAWLSLMQHYGLPTRLLDWSRSPLVAAYFAVQKYYDSSEPTRDAAIYVLSPHELNHHHAGIDVTPAIDSKICDNWLRPAFTNEDRPRETQNFGSGPIAVMATELDLRMFVQQGCFTIHKPATAPLDTEEVNGLRYRLRIPRERVHQFAMQIHALGFRSGDLFPDLNGLAAELIRSHPPGSVGPMKY